MRTDSPVEDPPDDRSPTAPLPSAVSRRLDTLGKACPLPILMTAKALIGLQLGETLEVVGDDPAIAEDMPVYCFRAGQRLLSLEEDAETGVLRCVIQKTSRAEPRSVGFPLETRRPRAPKRSAAATGIRPEAYGKISNTRSE